ncbi:hypothetical protein G3M48_008196 [Beauveria asiatica]|uniref:Ricin B lectin domain-containing protein n=1 Tax=Beauveria asiatica TaxID=1069075 RepID=A0AAW0RLA1_9HYPO
MSFPNGEFIIRNRENQRVLDDKDMSPDAGNPIIDYNYKPANNSNQRWTCRDNRLVNVHSNLYLTFKNLEPESTATQEGYRGEGQQFKYKEGIISLMNDDNRVVGAWDYDVKIVKPDPHDKARRWDLVSI